MNVPPGHRASRELRVFLGPKQSTRLATLGARLEYVGYDYENNMLSGRTRDDGTPCGFGGCRFNRPHDRRDSFTNYSNWLSNYSHDRSESSRL